jgi:large subunit ribosomal protein L6
MSRVGREPIPVPDGVNVDIKKGVVHVKGVRGELEYRLPGGIKAGVEDGEIRLTRRDDGRQQRSLHGLARSLCANMVRGVSEGFSRELEIVGVGYRCDQKERAIMLSVGYSHRVVFIPPDGIELKVTSPTTFTVSGCDRQLVGDIAARLRAIKPPEPYKGKGIKYAGEHIRRKAGKAAGA